MFKKAHLTLKTFWNQPGAKRERALVIATLAGGIMLSLWITSVPEQKPHDQASEELIVPAGYLIVPIDLANANALTSLVSHDAVIDVFQTKKVTPLAENLKIIKLNAGDGPLFGALVPRNLAGYLQEVFARGQLRGAIRTRGQGPVAFHLTSARSKALLEEVSTTENLSGENI